MATISLCMIVKNEEAVLGRCLDCAKGLVDEIIIVDTGSTDSTKEIAARYTDKVFDFQWIDDFAAARNFAFEKATCDFQMWLDADDVITPENQKLFLELKETLSADDTDVCMMKYDVAFDDGGNVVNSFYRERLLSRRCGFRWIGRIHEAITVVGKVIHSEVAITHSKLTTNEVGRNIRIFEAMLKEQELSPREKFYYARELMFAGRYEEAVEWFQKFVDEGFGWVENNIQACIDMSSCYQLMHNPSMRMQSLTRSFCYDMPRAEVCCRLGDIFRERTEYDTAIFWYELAVTQSPKRQGSFIDVDCYGFTPYIWLAVCYERLGKLDIAFSFHKKAESLKPNHPSVLYNQEYFEKVLPLAQNAESPIA